MLFAVSLVVFVASVSVLGALWFSYYQGQQKYKDIGDVSQFDPATLEDGLDKLVIDWDALKARNPDTVGWIYIPNTTISYPIVQGQDNDYYLYHDFDGDEGWLAEIGSIFLEARNSPEWTDQSIFIYGHHLNDGSMFSPLSKIDSQERYDECRTVYLLTPVGNARLRSFSLVHCGAYERFVQTEFADRAEYDQYLQDKIDRSEYDSGDIPPASQIRQSIALSTCDNDYQDEGRFVLFCYVEHASAAGLSGEVGIAEDEEGAATGFAATLDLT